MEYIQSFVMCFVRTKARVRYYLKMIKASKHLTLQFISTKIKWSLYGTCDIIELEKKHTHSSTEVHILTEHSCHCSNSFFRIIPLFFCVKAGEKKSCYTNQAHAICDFVWISIEIWANKNAESEFSLENGKPVSGLDIRINSTVLI